jgi:hypothetical protein
MIFDPTLIHHPRVMTLGCLDEISMMTTKKIINFNAGQAHKVCVGQNELVMSI